MARWLRQRGQLLRHQSLLARLADSRRPVEGAVGEVVIVRVLEVGAKTTVVEVAVLAVVMAQPRMEVGEPERRVMEEPLKVCG